MTKKSLPQPYYHGGDTALLDFITKNMVYPLDAVEQKIQGTVGIKFSIDQNGACKDCKIIKSLQKNCDEEAIRLVKLLKFEVNQKTKGLKLIYQKDIFIGFRLKTEHIQNAIISAQQNLDNG